MVKNVTKVSVSSRALIQRINRKLSQDKRFVRTARGYETNPLRGYRWDGHWYQFGVIDANVGGVVDVFNDPEEYGRELGVLADYETLAED
jgi:hypothetical protein